MKFNSRMHRVSPLNESLAREVAERAVAAVLRQLDSSVAIMPPAELRGYLRAHALPQIQFEIGQLVAGALPRCHASELTATALELATHTLLQQLKSNLTVSVPTPHVRLRTAA